MQSEQNNFSSTKFPKKRLEGLIDYDTSKDPLAKVTKIKIHREIIEFGKKLHKILEELEFNILSFCKIEKDTLITVTKPILYPQLVGPDVVFSIAWPQTENHILMLHKHVRNSEEFHDEFSDFDEIFAIQTNNTTILWDGEQIIRGMNNFYYYDVENIEIFDGQSLEDIQPIFKDFVNKNDYDFFDFNGLLCIMSSNCFVHMKGLIQYLNNNVVIKDFDKFLMFIPRS